MDRGTRRSVAAGAFLLLVVALLGFSAGPAAAQLGTTQEYSANADASWQVTNIQPSATVDFESLVFDFVEVNGRMFVAGRFGGVRPNSNGAVTNQSFLAAFNVNTGNWISSFRPVLNGPAFSLDVSPDGQRLFVGGEFTQVNGTNTGAFVALNPNNGSLVSTFNAEVEFTSGTVVVEDIEVASDGVYIGGNFNRITNGAGTAVTRGRLAKLNLTNGNVITAFNGSAQGARVQTIDVDGDRLYIGGYFSSANGAAGTSRFAALRSSNGSLVPGVRQGEFEDMPNFSGGTIPFQIEHFGNKVFLATEAHNLIILNRSNLNRIGFFHTQFGGGDYQALDVSGGRLYAGGHYWATQNYDTAAYPGGISGVNYRDNVHANSPTTTPVVWASAYNATTAAHEPSFLMDISAQSGVWAIKRASNGSLWVGGDLTRAGNRSVGGFAKFSVAPHTPLGPNLAPAGTANQSSTSGGLGADLGNDRLLSGRSIDKYLQTNNQANPWWQVDLGSARDIGAIRIWKPATCCGGAINGAKVFVSNTPFSSTNPNVTEGQAGVSTYTVGNVNRRAQVSVQRSGRYVRVQLPRTAVLYLDEVEVLESTGIVGGPVAPVSCSATLVNGDVRVDWVRAANDGASNFVVRRRRGTGQFFWAANRPAPATSWTNTSNLVNGANYTYTVETVAGGARSARTTCSPAPITITGGGGGGPLKPAACSVSLVNGNVRVNWTPAAGDGADRYVIRRARNNFSNFFWTGVVPAGGATTFTDSNIIRGQGQRYTYTVEGRTGAAQVSSVKWCSPVPIIP